MFGFLGTIADQVKGEVSQAVHDPELGAVVTDTVNKVRSDLAGGIARVGAGATTAAAGAVAPAGTSPVVLPFSRNQLWVIGGALVIAIVILLALTLGKK